MPGTKRIRAIISAQDRGFSSTMKGASLAIGAVGIAATAAGIALGQFLVDQAAQAVEAADIQAKAELDLAAALDRRNRSVAESLPALRDYAASLQDVTGIGDEIILQNQALLLALGDLDQEGLQKATRAGLDLAAAFDISLESAFRNVGRTLGGTAGELTELVPELRDLSREALMAGAGIDLLAEKFGGASTIRLRTFRGALEGVTNRIGDLREAVGAPLAEISTVLLRDVISPIIRGWVEAANEGEIFRAVLFDIAIAGLKLSQQIQTTGAFGVQFLAENLARVSILGVSVGEAIAAAFLPFTEVDFSIAIRELEVLRDLTPAERAERAARAASEWAQRQRELSEAIKATAQESITLADAVQAYVEVGREAIQWPAQAREGILALGREVVTLGRSINQNIRGVGVSSALALGDALVEAAAGAKFEFGEFLRRLLIDLVKATLQAALLQAILRGVGGPVGGFLSPGLLRAIRFQAGGLVPPSPTAAASAAFAGGGQLALVHSGEFVLNREVSDFVIEAAARAAGGPGVGSIELRSDIPLTVERINGAVRTGAVRTLATDMVSTRTVRG